MTSIKTFIVRFKINEIFFFFLNQRLINLSGRKPKPRSNDSRKRNRGAKHPHGPFSMEMVLIVQWQLLKHVFEICFTIFHRFFFLKETSFESRKWWKDLNSKPNQMYYSLLTPGFLLGISNVIIWFKIHVKRLQKFIGLPRINRIVK